MSKPIKMWIVKTPRGRLEQFTLSRTRRQAVDEAYFETLVRGSYYQPWSVFKAEGYSCVRVTVEEE